MSVKVVQIENRSGGDLFP